MSGLYKAYKTNESAEKDGIRLVVAVREDGSEVSVTLARAGGGNVRFLAVLNHKTKPYQRGGKVQDLDPSIARQIMREVYAECVILGWENVTDESDELLPFTKANVLKVLADLDDLFSDIIATATNEALYRASVLEDASKN